jgi:pimeloyl-ACP methyl ester carboxylesterase
MRLPYTAVEFTKDGNPADPAQIDAAVAMIGTGTDVLVLSHGWNNDIRAAERMFGTLADNIADLMDQRPGPNPRLTVVGLLWPSLKWASDGADIAGGGLAVADPALELIAAIDETVEDPGAAAQLKDLAHSVEKSADAQAEFLALLRSQLPPQSEVADDDPPPSRLRDGAPGEVFADAAEAESDLAGQLRLRGAESAPAQPGPTQPGPAHHSPFDTRPDPLGGAGSGAGFLDILKNPLKAARELLNVTTFYVMKDRAGQVGTRGVTALLTAANNAHPTVRVHLAGHSFGARVVSAAAATTNTPVSSVSLLQGAYSHRALAAKDAHLKMPDGAFRRAVVGGTVRGPIMITHTHNDKAVGLAYALASRLAHQVAADLGDAGDPYGGLGANGAVGTSEAVAGEMGDERTVYTFQPGRVHNVHGGTFIKSHGDVTNRAVANAVLAALTTR